MSSHRQCCYCKQSFQSTSFHAHLEQCSQRQKNSNPRPLQQKQAHSPYNMYNNNMNNNNMNMGPPGPPPQIFRGLGSVYALNEDRKQWADRGTSGTVIMFQNAQNKQDVRLKWEKNQTEIWWRLTSSKLKPKGERALVLKAWATSTNQQEILAIRFSNQEAAIEFAKKYHYIFPMANFTISNQNDNKLNGNHHFNHNNINNEDIDDSRSKISCCCVVLFWILILSVCGYLCWIMILPSRLKNHRLRYNQVNDFDVYEMKWSDWTNYRISTQTMSILTFKQQIEYEYQYILGSFQNYSDTHAVNENVTMHQLSWNEFSAAIDENLYIFQFSKTKCSDSFEDCFYLKNYEIERAYDLDLIYTPIKTYFVNIDSESVGSFFNGYMDVIMGLWAAIFPCVIIAILFSINFDEEDLVNRSTYLNLFLVLFSIIFGTYFLWINVLSFVPILFSSSLNWEPNNEFYASVYLAAAETNNEYSHSLIYSIGDYKGVMWVIGVVMNGVWWWTLMFSPFILLFGGTPFLCRRCCGEERADNIAGYMVVLIMGIILLAVCLMSIGNLVVFILNILMWNNVTYNVDDYFIQTLIGIGCVFIIVPIFGCVMMCISNKRRKSNNDDTHHPTRKMKSIEIIKFVKKVSLI